MITARARMALLLPLTLAACGGGGPSLTMSTPPTPTPTPTPTPIEDLDMKLQDFANIQGLRHPAGRNYLVANPLGHESEALAVASSPTGGTFPVGSIVEVQPREVMVKRRRGFNPPTNDWEFFAITFASDGKTPRSFAVRGKQETSCFQCHSSLSSLTWDYMCQHP
jgi:hypothetical protein